MAGKKILITVTDEQYHALAKLSEAEGLGRVSTLVKSLALKTVRTPAAEDTKEVSVTLENYSEINRYVTVKRFGSVSSFAGYAMEQHMQRNPLTAAQKASLGKNINSR